MEYVDSVTDGLKLDFSFIPLYKLGGHYYIPEKYDEIRREEYYSIASDNEYQYLQYMKNSYGEFNENLSLDILFSELDDFSNFYGVDDETQKDYWNNRKSYTMDLNTEKFLYKIDTETKVLQVSPRHPMTYTYCPSKTGKYTFDFSLNSPSNGKYKIKYRVWDTSNNLYCYSNRSYASNSLTLSLSAGRRYVIEIALEDSTVYDAKKTRLENLAATKYINVRMKATKPTCS